MDIRIALAGNPNSGKTTLFNALTGSNQFVGNWPGVTVEKKEGRLKNHDGVIVTDLPGIYSLSPYTLEEVVARKYLVEERPDAILDIVDGSNLERNLYLTTQMTELGIPVVIAINMMDVVRKNGDFIDIDALSKKLGCPIVEVTALTGDNIIEAAELAIEAAREGKPIVPQHIFSGPVEHAIAHIEEAVVHDLPEEQQRWYAIKVFERDEKVLEKLGISEKVRAHIEKDIRSAERELDDDAESIITNERYEYITRILQGCYKRAHDGKMTVSDKIDSVVTSRWLGLPIFALVMFLIYYISMVTVGAKANDWASNGVFGEGWHLFGIGSSETAEAERAYGDTDEIIAGLIAKASEDGIDTSSAENAADPDAEGFEPANAVNALNELGGQYPSDETFTYLTVDDETLETVQNTADMTDYFTAVDTYEQFGGQVDPADYGVWIPGLPVVIGNALEKANVPKWLSGLILDGIVAGVGSVLGFVPQMLVLFFLLAFVEAVGYMSRIAFVLDKIFRKFGLSGKSFIPILIGTGCGVPGIMASRTIENERDRRMTIMTTTFIPCGAKVPFISMIAGAVFGGSALIATGAYFIGLAAIIISGLMLKKTKPFAGEPSPFVMELPAYHWPPLKNVLRSMWERGWEFIKKAGTVILLSTMIIWFFTYFGFVDGSFRMLEVSELDRSILATIGRMIAWIFIPLGWGTWQAAVASITGLAAKENIVGTLGVLYGGGEQTVWQALSGAFTGLTAFSFMVFNLLCAPCFAAISAIRREMNSPRWTWFAIAYQCGFAYAVSLMINQFGRLINGNGSAVGVIFACLILAAIIYMLFIRKYEEPTSLKKDVKIK